MVKPNFTSASIIRAIFNVISNITSIILFLMIFSLFSCSCPPPPPTETKVQNFIVIIDLSNRIQESQQIERDKAIIKIIYQKFNEKVKFKDLYVKSKDSFSIIAIGNTLSEEKKLQYEDSLRINLANLQNNQKMKSVLNLEKKLIPILTQLYTDASSGAANISQGSTLWQYFNESLGDNLNNSSGKNLIFLLTDGYFKAAKEQSIINNGNRYIYSSFLNKLRVPDWRERFDGEDYGILPVHQKFDSLEVMVIEIKPEEGFLEELGLIQKMWSKWLNEMNITKYQILSQTSIGNLDEKIGIFINDTIQKVFIPPPIIEDSMGTGEDSIRPVEVYIKRCFKHLSEPSLTYQAKQEVIKEALQYFSDPGANVLIMGKYGVQTGRETISDYLNIIAIQNYNVTLLDHKTDEKGKIVELSLQEEGE